MSRSQWQESTNRASDETGAVHVVGTILAGAEKDVIPIWLGVTTSLIVIFWALNATIDLNAWHRRNLLLTCKAEQVFLNDDDYGRLLPAAYRKPKTGWITVYKINMIAISSLLLMTIFVWLPSRARFCPPTATEEYLPLAVLLVGVVLTVVNFSEQQTAARRIASELL